MKNVRMKVLSQEEAQFVHDKSCEILEKKGILFGGQEARDILRAHGCEVDDETQMVKIPKALVEECMAKCPKQFTLYSYNGNKDVVLKSDGSDVHYMTFGAANLAREWKAHGEYTTRDTCLHDLEEFAHVSEYCDAVDLLTIPCSAIELAEDPVRNLKEMKAIFTNSGKPFFPDCNVQFFEEYFKMTAAVYGKGEEYARTHPHLIFGTGPVSPMQIDEYACMCACNVPSTGIPIIVLNMGMSGATMPIDLAGTVVCNNVEIIAEIVLIQLVRPGHPIIYGTTTTELDLWNNAAPAGSPELSLISGAGINMAQFYQVPSLVGGC